ncbi:hypothetical protein D9758_016063 [Tetrapyrgos nigripes]|uniref:Uncharacterized protein n=1 Tax=Tetrapyrgos nigripes TaxID=182062 RepID=A0A8H5C6N6_9AGAR|nr:hypothetical protein D9758_016063 [Tetrapyrgos nigripes]
MKFNYDCLIGRRRATPSTQIPPACVSTSGRVHVHVYIFCHGLHLALYLYTSTSACTNARVHVFIDAFIDAYTFYHSCHHRLYLYTSTCSSAGTRPSISTASLSTRTPAPLARSLASASVLEMVPIDDAPVPVPSTLISASAAGPSTTTTTPSPDTPSRPPNSTTNAGLNFNPDGTVRTPDIARGELVPTLPATTPTVVRHSELYSRYNQPTSYEQAIHLAFQSLDRAKRLFRNAEANKEWRERMPEDLRAFIRFVMGDVPTGPGQERNGIEEYLTHMMAGLNRYQSSRPITITEHFNPGAQLHEPAQQRITNADDGSSITRPVDQRGIHNSNTIYSSDRSNWFCNTGRNKYNRSRSADPDLNSNSSTSNASGVGSNIIWFPSSGSSYGLGNPGFPVPRRRDREAHYQLSRHDITETHRFDLTLRTIDDASGPNANGIRNSSTSDANTNDVVNANDRMEADDTHMNDGTEQTIRPVKVTFQPDPIDGVPQRAMVLEVTEDGSVYQMEASEEELKRISMGMSMTRPPPTTTTTTSNNGVTIESSNQPGPSSRPLNRNGAATAARFPPSAFLTGPFTFEEMNRSSASASASEPRSHLAGTISADGNTPTTPTTPRTPTRVPRSSNAHSFNFAGRYLSDGDASPPDTPDGAGPAALALVAMNGSTSTPPGQTGRSTHSPASPSFKNPFAPQETPSRSTSRSARASGAELELELGPQLALVPTSSSPPLMFTSPSPARLSASQLQNVTASSGLGLGPASRARATFGNGRPQPQPWAQPTPSNDTMSAKQKGKQKAVETEEEEDAEADAQPTMSKKQKGKRNAVEIEEQDADAQSRMSKKQKGKRRAVERVDEEDALPAPRMTRHTNGARPTAKPLARSDRLWMNLETGETAPNSYKDPWGKQASKKSKGKGKEKQNESENENEIEADRNEDVHMEGPTSPPDPFTYSKTLQGHSPNGRTFQIRRRPQWILPIYTLESPHGNEHCQAFIDLLAQEFQETVGGNPEDLASFTEWYRHKCWLGPLSRFDPVPVLVPPDQDHPYLKPWPANTGVVNVPRDEVVRRLLTQVWDHGKKDGDFGGTMGSGPNAPPGTAVAGPSNNGASAVASTSTSRPTRILSSAALPRVASSSIVPTSTTPASASASTPTVAVTTNQPHPSSSTNTPTAASTSAGPSTAANNRNTKTTKKKNSNSGAGIPKRGKRRRGQDDEGNPDDDGDNDGEQEERPVQRRRTAATSQSRANRTTTTTQSQPQGNTTTAATANPEPASQPSGPSLRRSSRLRGCK